MAWSQFQLIDKIYSMKITLLLNALPVVNNFALKYLGLRLVLLIAISKISIIIYLHYVVGQQDKVFHMFIKISKTQHRIKLNILLICPSILVFLKDACLIHAIYCLCKAQLVTQQELTKDQTTFTLLSIKLPKLLHKHAICGVKYKT